MNNNEIHKINSDFNDIYIYQIYIHQKYAYQALSLSLSDNHYHFSTMMPS